MANKIKFHKRLSTISAPTTADDGVYFVKSTGSTSFGIEVINNGVKATLDAVNSTQARASLVTSTSATGVSNVATTNNNTYLNITQNGASPGSSTQITGAGTVTVTSDTAGKITITGSTTSYSAGTTTLLNTGTDTTDRLWSALVLKSYYNNYLLRTGGSLSDSLKIANGTNTAGWQNNTVNDANNYIQNNILALTTNNQGLHFFGDYTMNTRRMGIQSSHALTGYANVPGILELNPFGGVVRIGSGGLNINGALNFNNGSSIESQMADGSVKHFKNNVTNLYNNSVGGTYASYQTLTSRATSFTGTTLTLTHKSGTTLTVNSTGTNTVVNKVFSIAGYIKINGEIPTAEVWTATPITSQGDNSSLKNYYDETTGYFECVHQYRSATGWLIHKTISTLVVGDVITISNLTFVEDITPLDWQLGLLDLKYLIDSNYSAGNGLTLSGTTFSLPVTSSGSGNAVTAVTASTNGLTVTKADTFLKKIEPVVGLLAATYAHRELVSASTRKSKLRITLPFKTNAGVMLSFTIRLYGGYRAIDILCSGYLYSSPNNWYSPSATIVAENGVTTSLYNNIQVVFGRDEDGYAYVTIPNFDYIGVAVLNAVRGYSNTGTASPILPTIDWTITENEDTPNISLTLNISIRDSIPVATSTLKGLVKGGTNISIASDGTLSATNTTYTAGNGLTLSGTAFSLPVTTSGSGNAVTAVTQSTTGITITKGSTFSLSNHTHDSIIGRVMGSTSTDVNTDITNTTVSNVTWYSNINKGTSNLFPNTNNANGILHLSTHQLDHWHQLGFSSNKNLYHRYQNGAWSQIITDKDTTRLNDSNHMNYYFLVSVNTASPLPFQDYDNTTLTAYVSGRTYPAFEVSMNVTATGTVTGTKYILYINSNKWEVIKIGNATDTSSNHPVLFVDTDGVPKIKMASHATKYPVACFVRRLNVSNNVFDVKRLFGLTFDSLLGTPTTLSGYGITNAMSTSHAANAITTTNISNWNTAYSNNHTHSNKANLDLINQNLSSTAAPTFGNITITNTANANLGYNQGSLQTATYGAYGGFLQTSTNGPVNGNWYNIIKMLHSNSAGFYTELAMSFTGDTGLFFRRMVNGELGPWRTVATTETARASLVTSTSATGTTNVATTNTNTYLNVTQNGASPGSSTQVTGAGSVTVTSDTTGKLTITGTNTTYSEGSLALLQTGTDTGNRVWSANVLTNYLDNTLAISRVKTKYTTTANVSTKAIFRLNITTIGSYFTGHLKVSFTSSYSNANANGIIVIEGGIGVNSSSIWNNQLTCTLSQGVINDNYYVDPVMKWDETNKQIYLEIHKIATSGNHLHVKVEYFGINETNHTPTIVTSATSTTVTTKNVQRVTSGLSVSSSVYDVLTINRNDATLGANILFNNSSKTLGHINFDNNSVFRVLNGSSTEVFRADSSGIVSSANVSANKFIKSGGTSSQFLKADGSVDSNVYTTHTHSNKSNLDTINQNLSKTDTPTFYRLNLSAYGTSWIVGHNTPSINISDQTSTSSYFAWITQKLSTGASISMGTLNSSLYVSYAAAADVTSGNNNTTKVIEINSAGLTVVGKITKSGGTSAQFLKADGSVDSTAYTTDAKARASLVTSTSATGTTNVATTNTNTYLNVTQNGASPGSSTQVTGAGSVTVSSDANGKLTITGTDTNTTYWAGNGLTLSDTTFSLPITDSGSGNTVSNVTTTTNGLTITKVNTPRTANISTYVTNTVQVLDNRDVAVTPNTTLQRGIQFDFKNTSALSLTGASTYASVITMAPYGDNTGNTNTAFQLAQSSNNIYFRNWGTAWGTWERLVKASEMSGYTTTTQARASLVTSTSATGTTNVATTNTNTYLNITQNGASPGSSTQVTGAGSVTVSSDANGKLTITGTDTNTTYSAGTLTEIESNTTTARIWAGSILNSKFAKYLPLAGGTATGTIKAPGFENTSLRRLKENIVDFDKSGIELVDSLKITTFDRKDTKQKNIIGIIADDTKDEFLNDNKDAVDLYKTIFIQAKAIQELNEQIKSLTEIVNKLITK